ncbi:MAG: hypothetical protein LYZ70_05770 [Nitrososphaerales archaeon]|nr:hypothetical protein [Nitrososphaerales archaeon]
MHERTISCGASANSEHGDRIGRILSSVLSPYIITTAVLAIRKIATTARIA